MVEGNPKQKCPLLVVAKGVVLLRIRLTCGEIWFEALRRNGVYYLRWPRAVEASVGKEGRLLQFDQKPAARTVSIQILRRIVRAYAKSLQGKEALHATALERKGKAIALIGPSGEGKSTLAACLLKSNPSIRLLSDDLLYVRVRKDQAWILPHREAPRLKLSRQITPRFGFRNSEFDPNLEKEIVTFPFCSGDGHPIPLSAIVQLHRGERRTRLKLERIKGAKAALTLMANIYNEILRPPRVLKNQFELCAAISRHVPVWKLTLPSGFKALTTVTQRIDPIWTS